MKKATEKMWRIYKSEVKHVVREDEKELIGKINSTQQRLFKNMTPEQIEIFCEYEESAEKRQEIFEMESFAAGVQFAISVFVEALK